MKRLGPWALLLLLPLLLALPAAAAEAQAAAYQSVRGIKVEFTPSSRTGRYRFEVYEPGSTDPLCSKLFDSVTAAQTVFLPVECQPGERYTIRVTALPEPGREGLDIAASKEQEFTPQPVCGHTAAEGGFLYGSGTVSDPYIVSTPAQLQHLNHAGHMAMGQSFLQSRDIDLLDPAFYQDGKPYDADADPGNGNWVSIAKEDGKGSSAVGFLGYYDGGGHVIRNISYSITSPEFMDAGIFGYLRGGSIQNLGVEDFDFTGSFAAGGILGASHNNVTISNCYVKNGKLKAPVCGGLGGYLHMLNGNLAIADCYTAGVSCTYLPWGGKYYASGGAVGYLFSSSGRSAVLSRNYTIPNSLGSFSYMGAVAGSLTYTGAYAYGSVSDSYFLSGTYSMGIGYPSSNSGAAPLSEAAFADAGSFPGWDFENTWTMGSVTYTDASGSARTVAAPVLRVFEQQDAGTARAAGAAAYTGRLSLGESER